MCQSTSQGGTNLNTFHYFKLRTKEEVMMLMTMNCPTTCSLDLIPITLLQTISINLVLYMTTVHIKIFITVSHKILIFILANADLVLWVTTGLVLLGGMERFSFITSQPYDWSSSEISYWFTLFLPVYPTTGLSDQVTWFLFSMVKLKYKNKLEADFTNIEKGFPENEDTHKTCRKYISHIPCHQLNIFMYDLMHKTSSE